jgi:hypothetical protein
MRSEKSASGSIAITLSVSRSSPTVLLPNELSFVGAAGDTEMPGAISRSAPTLMPCPTSWTKFPVPTSILTSRKLRRERARAKQSQAANLAASGYS